jgi:aspartyl/asparaginyl beta-hydroxylase (cupin superfamily)
MSEAVKNLWFSYFGGHFKGEEPYYFDKSMFPWVSRIESQWTTIRDEMLQLVQQEGTSLVPYANHEMTSKKNHWKTFGLMFWTVKSETNCAKAPKTWQILQSIPNITAASFNLLEGGATIKEHYGDTNAIVRCHLGLVIPAPAPQCAFRVGKEVRSWKEGEFLMFCDAHNHTAWNNTDQKRYIMIIDVMRPDFVSKKIAISSRVLASINHEIAYQRWPLLPRFFGRKAARVMVFNLFRAFYWVVLRLRLSISMMPN